MSPLAAELPIFIAAKEVMFSPMSIFFVGWLICKQNYTKTTCPRMEIFVNFSRNIGLDWILMKKVMQI